MVDIASVVRRVNAARMACSATPIDRLPKGERRSPCFCPLGRVLRKDHDDSLLLAVGTQHLRIGACDTDIGAVASRIRKAWGLKEGGIGRESEQFVIVPLPAELKQFVIEFDAGQLPEFEGKVDQMEVAQLDSLAKRLWNTTTAKLRTSRSIGMNRKNESS